MKDKSHHERKSRKSKMKFMMKYNLLEILLKVSRDKTGLIKQIYLGLEKNLF